MMQQRPVRPFDPPMVVGMRQPTLRGRRKFFGLGCGHWLFGCLMMMLSVMAMCGISMVFFISSPPPATTVLVVGIDARTEQDMAIARTDSVMVIKLDPQGQEIVLFSIPRDVVVNSPNYGPLPVNVILRNAELDNPGSGIDELRRSIETTFDIKINDVIRVNFDGFVDIVNAAGGVEIDVPKRIVDQSYPTEDYGTMVVEFDPGVQFMDGERALIYARTRHADDDYNRASRQQQVIEAVFNKLANPLNFFRVPLVTGAIIRNTETDMAIGTMFQYMPTVLLYGRNSNNLERFVLEREYLSYDTAGNATPNLDALKPWLDEHLR